MLTAIGALLAVMAVITVIMYACLVAAGREDAYMEDWERQKKVEHPDQEAGPGV